MKQTDINRNKMTEQEQKAVEAFKEDYILSLDGADKLTRQDIIEQNLNAIDAGIEFALFDLRKPSEPDKELLDALKKICKVAPSYIKNPDDELDNAICDAMLAVYDYEQKLRQ